MTKKTVKKRSRKADAESAGVFGDAGAGMRPQRESSSVGTVFSSLWRHAVDAVVGIGRVLWEWSWILSLLLSAVMAAALASFSRLDPAFSVSASRSTENWCGLWGAWLSDLALGAFGLSAWWIVLGLFMVAFFAVRSFVRRSRGETNPERINPPKFSAALGFMALMLGSSGLEALRLQRFGFELPAMPGGILGSTVGRAVVHYVGLSVATAVFVALVAMGLSLLMDFSWANVSEAVGRFIDTRLLSLFQKGREPSVTEEPAFTTAANEVVPDAANARTEEPRPSLAIREPEVQKKEPVLVRQPQTEEKPEPAPVMPPPPPPVEPDPVPPPLNERPGLELLDPAPEAQPQTDNETITQTSRLIVSKLKSYNIDAAVAGAQPGPVITQYWLEPGPGVKGSQIENARDDLRRALGVQAVRVVPTVPGTPYIALEVPNPKRQTVKLTEILTSETFAKSKSLLTLAIGKDIAGQPFVMDLAKAPHLLVAGTTGSGKSVGINAMILSMLFRATPAQLRLVLVDPKMLEFSLYNDIPHLLCPVVTDMNKASSALKWLTREMDNRYAMMSKMGVRHFTTYNERVAEAERRGEPIRDPMAAPDDPNAENLKTWPYIVCVVDELADLMLTNRKEVEGEITRLTQKARAAGIHLILATQRPSADVVTSLIKANVPTRISFQVASAIDSRIILGDRGAEQLLGYGDMLLHRPGEQTSTRIQGCFVSDGEVQRVADELRLHGAPEYVLGVTEAGEEDGDGDPGAGGGGNSGESDPLYDKAVQIVLTERRASISYVQRRLQVGYNRAANLLETMETAGIVSKANATGRREILVPENE